MVCIPSPLSGYGVHSSFVDILLPSVKSVILGVSGVLEGMHTGGIVVDMTTSEPSLALEIYNEAKKKGVHSIDAPVSGISKLVLTPPTYASSHLIPGKVAMLEPKRHDYRS